MTYVGDLKLDSYGNSVISNGDLSVTESQMEFIIHSLFIEPGSWKINPVLGFGLERYIGEMNTVRLRQEMRNDLVRYFREYNIDVDVLVIPIDSSSIICNLTLVSENITTAFTFDLESGVFVFPSDTSVPEYIDEEIEATNIREPTNKYISRRDT